METRQKKRLTARFGSILKQKKIRDLGIPDKYAYMERDLVEVAAPQDADLLIV